MGTRDEPTHGRLVRRGVDVTLFATGGSFTGTHPGARREAPGVLWRYVSNERVPFRSAEN